MKRLLFPILFYLLIFSTAGCVQREGINNKTSAYKEVIADYQEIVIVADDYKNREQKDAYEDIFTYARQVMNDILGETKGESYRDLIDMIILCRIIDSFDGTYVYPIDSFGCALKDLNGNGNDELVLLLDDYFILAVFSLLDGEPVLLESFRQRYNGAINDKGILITRGSGGAAYTTWSAYQISKDGGRLELIEEFGTDGNDDETLITKYYRMVDGDKKAIEKDEFDMLLQMFGDKELEEITKESGLEFIQLFDDND